MPNEAVEAVVQVAGEETAYLRAGSGPVVLLLRLSSSLAALRADPLFITLSVEFRVVAPDVPAERGPTGWVRDVVDGLGLDRPAVVVDAGVAGAAIRVAITEDRCGSLALLCVGTPAGVPDFAHDCEQCGVRLLELRLGGPGNLDGAELEALLAFLRCSAQ